MGTQKNKKTTSDRQPRKVAGDAQITLPSVLDMRACRSLKAMLLEIYERKEPCVIESGGVTRVSTGCMQILASFAIGMAANSVRVQIANPSDVFLTAASRLGLNDILTDCGMEREVCRC